MITGVTRILGVIGDPISHTSSPAMHNAAIAALGLDYTYVAFHVRPDELGQAIEGVRALQIAGLNVTVPHKQGVMAHLNEGLPEPVPMADVIRVVNAEGRSVENNTIAFGYFEV